MLRMRERRARTDSLSKQLVIAGVLICTLVVGAGCRHSAPTASIPSGAQSTVAEKRPPLLPDQVNIVGWDMAWTNLVNDAEQSFTPTMPRLEAVEVELLVGNPGATEDALTLTIIDARGQVVSEVTKFVQSENCDQVMFELPNGGVDVSPGTVYRLKLSGGNTFGWKYIVGGYEKGEATFNWKPLLVGTRSTFLFRTFGAE
jgi:hypothetical protein